MTTLVYRFKARAPEDRGELAAVLEQMRAGHDYANDLTAIERGRRDAIRAIDAASPEVVEAESIVRAATRSTRKATIESLHAARAKARASAEGEIRDIEERAHTLRLGARALTTAYWGTYLTIESSADQARKTPYYADDGLTPSSPRFRRWGIDGNDAQIGVQLQKGLVVSQALAGVDRRLRIEMRDARYGDVLLRVGSNGRDPVFARFSFGMNHNRVLPPDGIITWARVSRRRYGRDWRWTVEFTVENGAYDPQRFRDMDARLDGWIVLEPCWELDDERLRVARWRDHLGNSGEEFLSPFILEGFDRAERIRSVRDIILDAFRPALAEALGAAEELPAMLREAKNVMHLWKSPQRFFDLMTRWKTDAPSVASNAYRMLEAWRNRDDHLWRYEYGARAGALNRRRKFYEALAVRFASSYRQIILPKRDYSREARFGAESDLRFRAAPSELCRCLDARFLGDAMNASWARRRADETVEGDRIEWLDGVCERLNAAQEPLVARNRRKPSNGQEKGGAWARRKAKKKERLAMKEQTARKPLANVVE